MSEFAYSPTFPQAADATAYELVTDQHVETVELGGETFLKVDAEGLRLLAQLQAQKATVFAMDCIPRVLSRGQAFDALSSQANILRLPNPNP